GVMERAAGLCLSLAEYWERRGRLREGWLSIGECVMRSDALRPSHIRANLLERAGWIAYLLGEYATSIAWQTESLELCRLLDYREGLASALNNLATVRLEQGAMQEAADLFRESLAIWRELGDVEKQAARLSNLGLVSLQQSLYPDAESYLQEAHALFEQLKDPIGMGGSLCNLSDLALRRKDWLAARELAAGSLQWFRGISDRRGIACSLANLAASTLRLGDYDAADSYVREALTICLETGLRGLAPSLLEMRSVLLASSRRSMAHFALTASQTIRERLHISRSEGEEELLNQSPVQQQDGLPEPDRTAISNMSWEEMLAQVCN
ncbi:MAG TPA: tetratricopeptide repeat protein, partial [Chthonomonadales bacterium]|nr:tetratricopeptide repeat protein [Chthonomonadales bacterium]